VYDFFSFWVAKLTGSSGRHRYDDRRDSDRRDRDGRRRDERRDDRDHHRDTLRIGMCSKILKLINPPEGWEKSQVNIGVPTQPRVLTWSAHWTRSSRLPPVMTNGTVLAQTGTPPTYKYC